MVFKLRKKLASRFDRSRKKSPALRLIASGVLAAVAVGVGVSNDNSATAYGDTRTLSLYYTHTKDNLNITFKRNGYYDRDALKQLNYFLRDWRRNEPTDMDPKLFDTLWEVYREAGYEGETINVVSAYRSPETNGMLRRRSRAVAKHSQHMLGKAMDTTMPGVPMSKIREIGVRLQRGGVGYYPTAGTPFVHIDVGSVRAWPRMNTSQLMRLFPDQKTVHLPSDGPPLAGYQDALAEIQRNGGSVGGGGDEDEGGGSNFFAALFGGGSATRGSRTASRSSGQQLALASTSDNDTGSRSFFVNGGVVPRAQAEAPARSRTTRIPVQVPVQVQAETPAAPVAPVQLASARPRPIEETTPEPVKTSIEIKRTVLDTADEPAGGAIIPLPPRKPVDLMLLAGLPLTNIPLPPQRPSELLTTRLALATADPLVVALPQDAAMTAQKTNVPANVPLPPLIAGRPQPAPRALGFAAVDVPLPPARVQTPVIASAASIPLRLATAAPEPVHVPPTANPPKPAVQPANIRLTGNSGVTLKTLMSGKGLSDTRSASSKVDAAQVALLMKNDIIAQKFEQGGSQKLEAGKFTGGMVQPLGASFVKKAE